MSVSLGVPTGANVAFGSSGKHSFISNARPFGIGRQIERLDPQAWLADVLTRINDHPASRLAELLPWNCRGPRHPRPPLPDHKAAAVIAASIQAGR
jgi:hypothetical protein